MKLPKTKIELITKRATKHLGTPFTYRSCVKDRENAEYWTVRGTIQRYDKKVRVEISFNHEEMIPKYWMISETELEMPVTEVGQIVLGQTAIVSDPCYTRGIWCAEMLDNVRPGRWDTSVCIDTIDSWGERVYVLEVIHSDFSENNHQWENYATLGVDSGTMSVFNSDYYRIKDGSGEAFEADAALRDQFSEEVWDLKGNDMYGIYQKDNKSVGVICSSGCGDGGYPLYLSRVNGEIIGIRVEFS